ncbi:hypothetical protein Xbed_00675 [Xenorhabdus beddingii]|uniref:Uncharacterized protein n=1 Tax=Xenorhabdus beddingii TaxID=40578 RepID=A0A1Y2SQT8_9GAMM|nr:hypothetical protein [Xenorhabdus beddingii]OTA21444.1 hypothetical protein Xbed_00675 [Xenorhabdus beddingii]
MMIENILQDAIRHSRYVFRGKTTNKTYRDTTRLSENKRAMYDPQNITSREDKHDEFLDKLHKIEHPINQYQYSLSQSDAGEELIGNCGELTTAVFSYLAKHRSSDILECLRSHGRWDRSNAMKPIYILFLVFDNPYDHCITVITHPEHTQHIPKIGQSYRALPDNSWVCDSWAKIACSSEEYITRWKVKMLRWELVGKTTSIYQPEQELDDDMHYPSSLRPRNYHAMTHSIKRVEHMAVIHPNGSTNII